MASFVDNSTNPPTEGYCPLVSEEQHEQINDLEDKVKKIIAHKKSGICQNFDKFIEEGVPKEALQQALAFQKSNMDSFKKKDIISIGDYSQNSKNERFYILNLKTGEVKKHKVSHGSGNKKGVKYGDKNHDGMIDKCKHSNGSRTNMTRPGFFATAEKYKSRGKGNNHLETRRSDGSLAKGWPYVDKSKNNALRMDGLSSGINGAARSNGVVMHGSWYNDKRNTGQDIMGRSYGCPAFSSEDAPDIINTIANGSLYYSYVPKCKDDHKKIIEDTPNWETMCEGESDLGGRETASDDSSENVTVSKDGLKYSKVQEKTKKIIEEEFSDLAELEIKDIANICPDYNSFSNDEKLEFFSHFISATSKYESNHNPNTIYTESTGNKSTGLLQISKKSIANVYVENGCKGISSTDSLKDPDKNIRCGLAIMKRWIKEDGVLTQGKKGAGRYWSTLRAPYTWKNPNTGKSMKLGKLDKVTATVKNNFALCK